jgi:hypothetical protein
MEERKSMRQENVAKVDEALIAPQALEHTEGSWKANMRLA